MVSFYTYSKNNLPRLAKTLSGNSDIWLDDKTLWRKQTYRDKITFLKSI